MKKAAKMHEREVWYQREGRLNRRRLLNRVAFPLTFWNTDKSNGAWAVGTQSSVPVAHLWSAWLPSPSFACPPAHLARCGIACCAPVPSSHSHSSSFAPNLARALATLTLSRTRPRTLPTVGIPVAGGGERLLLSSHPPAVWWRALLVISSHTCLPSPTPRAAHTNVAASSTLRSQEVDWAKR